MGDLQRKVERRAGSYGAIGALRWLQIREVTPEAIYQACEPMLSLDLWQQLVNEGYRTHLPDVRSPACVRVVVIWDAMSEPGFSIQELSQSIQEARSLLTGMGGLSAILIVLGDTPSINGKDMALFWPRLRMSPVTLGGMRVSRARVLEACQHILVAFIQSNLEEILDELIGEKGNEVQWLVVGASALIVDPPEVQHWLQEAVLREVLAPILSDLSDSEVQQVEEQAKEEVGKIRRAMLEEIVASFKEIRWDIELEKDQAAIARCALEDPPLLEAIFGPYQQKVFSAQGDFFQRIGYWLVALISPFLPEDLGEKLGSHYLEIVQTLKQWLSPSGWRGLTARASQAYQSLEERLLGPLLDPTLAPDVESPQVTGITGLKAVILALQAIEKHLAEEGDLEDARTPRREKIRPAPLDSETYLRAAAELDAQTIRGKLLQYAHFCRTLASPWGVLLNLLPAWFLGAFLVSALAEWGTGKSFLVVGLVLLAFGIGELTYWWLFQARRLLKRVLVEASESLAKRTLSIVTRSLQDHQRWMIIRLQDVEQSLADVYALLRERHRETEAAWKTLEEARSYAREGTYHLVDKEQIRTGIRSALQEVCEFSEWQERAQEVFQKRYETRPTFRSAVTALIAATCWPLAERPAPPWVVLRELETRCREEAEKNINPDLLSAAVVAENVDGLRGGQRWDWLWRQAQPLGHTQAMLMDFTVIIAREEMLSGPTGRGSPHWQSGWRVALSRNPYEEMCIRGLAEGRGKA